MLGKEQTLLSQVAVGPGIYLTTERQKKESKPGHLSSCVRLYSSELRVKVNLALHCFLSSN